MAVLEATCHRVYILVVYVFSHLFLLGIKIALFYIFVLLMYGCARSLLLCRGFSSYGEQGLLSSFTAGASQCRGFSCCGAWSLGFKGFSSGGVQGLECTASSICGTQA